MNWFEKQIRGIAPEWYEKRMQAKANAYLIERQLQKMQSKDEIYRTYEAATITRRGNGFKGANGQSANRLVGKYAKPLRERTRYMFNNTPTTKRAVRSIANNVVGLGIIPTPKCDQKLLEIINKEWQLWGEKNVCDWNGKLNFYGLQKLVTKTFTLSGECYAIRQRVKSDVNKLGLQVMLLEPDFLDATKNQDRTSKNGYIQNGIEYDSEGKIIGYWFYPIHPDIRVEESKFISKENVAHIYEIDRPAQDRGVPGGASVMLTEKDLDDYKDSELMGKKVAGAYAGYVTTNDPDGEDLDDDDNGISHIEPGTIRKLNNGESITFSSPPSSPSFEPFVSVFKRDIAMGWGISYEMLTGDYSKVNFSSGRMGWIETQRNIDDWQWNVVIPDFCDVVYGWFIEAVGINIGKKEIRDLVSWTWTTPRREMIDPSKEVAAIKEQLKARLISWQEVVRMASYIPNDLFKELQEDAQRFGITDNTPDWAIPNAPQQQIPTDQPKGQK